MTVTLPNLRWPRCYAAHMGCLKAGLDFMGRDVSEAWVYGATAHAMVVNYEPGTDVSGPTAWNTEMIETLARNIGLIIQGMKAEKEEAGDSYPQRQREAWDFVRAALDKGLPCYGWEVRPWIPDYGLIIGYDEAEGTYLYSAFEDGRVKWDELGDHDVKVLSVHSMAPCDPAPDDRTVREALEAAIKHAEAPGDWIEPGYVSGPAAFYQWADDLASGAATRDGHSYISAFWRECRAMAVDFIGEVHERLPGRGTAHLQEAADHYATVRDCLAQALVLHPERPGREADWRSPMQSDEAAALLRQAAEAEGRALEAIRKLAALL
jgi:hypothetical protein